MSLQALSSELETWLHYKQHQFGGREKLEVLFYGILALMLGRYLLQSIYNILFHPLAAIPGPSLAKVIDSYLSPAQARLHRAQTLSELHKTYGPVVRVGTNEVSVSDWNAYRTIYGQKASSKRAQFYQATRLAGNDNLFTFVSKPAHSARRKLQNPSYSLQAVLDNESFIVDKTNVLVKRMTKASDGANPAVTTADVFKYNGLFSLEVILKCAFNRSYGDVVEGDALKLLRNMDSSAVAIQVHTALPLVSRFLGKRLPGSVGASFRSWDTWQVMTTSLIEDFHREELASDSVRQRFMITPMIVNVDSFMERRLTQGELVEEMMALTFAGSGTTSSTLTYLMYALARDGKTQERLREELSTSGTTFNELKDLPFLSAVIKETMRLYPTIMSTLPRVLDQAIHVDKVVLAEGTVVGMQNYVHHRDAKLFPRPNEFLPDRWLANENEAKAMNSALTPFSLGPRNCIGQNLARAELYLATSQVFRKLRLTLNAAMECDDMEMEDRFNIAPKGRRCLLDVEVLG
ncbi:putative sterigmatocystin biosynthesis monooxygenase STCB [Cyphellophora attinorum]|uniref:Putative sterigmatocystin biosynthesis monooxygenase STCB n=1 Tax=Cyphellophora attinorum TaxID=1664694 RepID=A0A0N0NQM8_9EURO|nr:putative sterigmatocystin biosynthesis monooxygenase STCB [Phialophora attinorum]KPI44091.1 putative sterigmatocystin biosynthesis monooxygenase STCB [Phialophora attinorum]